MNTGIVVYDGDCGICQASADWIKRNVPGVSVVSHYEYGVHELGSVWFINDTQMWEGADAVAHVLMRARKKIFHVVGKAMLLPGIRQCATGVYRVIAHNRRHISRLLGLKACAVPKKV